MNAIICDRCKKVVANDHEPKKFKEMTYRFFINRVVGGVVEDEALASHDLCERCMQAVVVFMLSQTPIEKGEAE